MCRFLSLLGHVVFSFFPSPALSLSLSPPPPPPTPPAGSLRACLLCPHALRDTSLAVCLGCLRPRNLKLEVDYPRFSLFTAVATRNKQGVKADDVQQGALGDCWLVAAMATLAGTMPGAIKKLFINSERSFRQASTREGQT